MVRLITHNLLSCHVSEYSGRKDNEDADNIENCNKDNFPLEFSDVEIVIRESEPNYDFLRRFLPKLEWTALVDTARSVSCEVASCRSKLTISSATSPYRTSNPRSGQMNNSRLYIMS